MPITSGINANVFRAVSGNLFSTTANWSRGIVPTGSDVADIADNCVIDISRTIGTLVVRPGFTASINTGLILNVSSSFDVQGHFLCNGSPNIFLSGKYNRINGMNPGTSRFYYKGLTEQLLPGGPYHNLECSFYDGLTATGFISNKKLTSNLVINGYLQINYGTLELGQYDYYCSGSTLINGGLYGTLSKSQPGNVIFNGALRNTAAGYPLNLINFSNGNPTIEVRNGIDLYQYNIVNTGKGTWRFTTNNQSLYNTAGSSTIIFDGPVSIENVALSVLANASTVTLNDVINGTTPSSQLINSGTINFNSATSLNSMTTGSFNFTSSNNTIGFTGNYSTTISTRYGVLRNLSISGTGTKTLGTSSYISGALTLNNPGVLELSSHNLTVSGTTNISSTNGLTKSSPGNITFIGRPTINNPYTINLSGNPNVECRNGILNQSNPTSNLGTGSWTFTTNNQDLTWGGSGNSSEFYNVIVSGSITVNAKSNYVAIRNSLNGTEAGSTFVNSGSLYLFFGSTPMSIGSLIIPTGSSNLIGYFVSGAFTIPRTAYYSLAVGGGGQKTLSGNTTIYGDLTVAAGLTSSLECLGYNLIVSGTTTVAGDGAYINIPSLNISGSGNIVFRGLFNVANPGNISFPGNPNIELQGGIQFQSNNNPNVGTGSWTFTTNNQNLIFAGSGPTYNIYNMIVSGAITLTYTGDTIRNINSLNGTNPNSKLLMAANSTFYYYGSSAPMSTGILDVTSSLGTTFIYASGSQNIKGGIYRNLTMNYGTKTLQGNVSVLGTLNTGSGATLATVNLNGFTLTNP